MESSLEGKAKDDFRIWIWSKHGKNSLIGVQPCQNPKAGWLNYTVAQRRWQSTMRNTRDWKVRKLLQKVKRKVVKVLRPPVEIELKDPSVWDREYTSDIWDYLGSVEQLPRYAMIEAWRQYFSPHGSILDLGCGEGIVLRRIPENAGVCYTGVDFSQAAIEIARKHVLHPNRETFIHEDVNSFVPPDQKKFDVILFNEVLYYFPDASRIVTRYQGFLKTGGVLIVSVFHPNVKTWKQVELLLHDVQIQSVNVTISQPRKGWHLGIYRPVNAASGEKGPIHRLSLPATAPNA